MTERLQPQERRPRARPSEVILSAVAVSVIFFLAVNAFVAYFCLDPAGCELDSSAIWRYRSAAIALMLAIVGTVILAVRRRATYAIAWHACVGLVGLVAVVLFAVPPLDLHDHRSPEPPNPSSVPCYSGSGDCPAG